MTKLAGHKYVSAIRHVRTRMKDNPHSVTKPAEDIYSWHIHHNGQENVLFHTYINLLVKAWKKIKSVDTVQSTSFLPLSLHDSQIFSI